MHCSRLSILYEVFAFKIAWILTLKACRKCVNLSVENDKKRGYNFIILFPVYAKQSFILDIYARHAYKVQTIDNETSHRASYFATIPFKLDNKWFLPIAEARGWLEGA